MYKEFWEETPEERILDLVYELSDILEESMPYMTTEEIEEELKALKIEDLIKEYNETFGEDLTLEEVMSE